MIAIQHRVLDVRKWFKKLNELGEYVTDKTGCKMLEVVGATFMADEEAIFGTVNRDYVNREIEWYKTTSRSVHDIPGGSPKEWLRCAGSHGLINSNYGYLVWSHENGFINRAGTISKSSAGATSQYDAVLLELKKNPESRRAVMVYTRPRIWRDYDAAGMNDFICTNTVQYFVRDGTLVALVQMRSNDVVFGYKNDKAWQDYVHQSLAADLNIPVGPMIWHAGSLHVYERHFQLIV